MRPFLVSARLAESVLPVFLLLAALGACSPGPPPGSRRVPPASAAVEQAPAAPAPLSPAPVTPAVSDRPGIEEGAGDLGVPRALPDFARPGRNPAFENHVAESWRSAVEAQAAMRVCEPRR